MSTFRTPRVRMDPYGGRWIDGEFDMGRYRVPPMPPRIGMTDRVTGLVKVLSDDGTNLVLADPTRAMPDVDLYGPYDGPYDNGYRLFLSAGVLAAELYPPATQSAKILTRNAFKTTVLWITVNNSGTVVYTPYTL